MAYKPFKLSDKQINYAKKISETLNLTLPTGISTNLQIYQKFIENNKEAFNKKQNEERYNTILKNLPLPQMAEILGFKQNFAKGDGDWKTYYLGETDKLLMHPVMHATKKFNIYVCSAINQAHDIPPQINIKNLTPLPQDKIRKYNPSKSGGGGDVIQFMLNRTLNYSFADVMNMLHDIALDIKNAEKYGLDCGIVANKDYSIKNIGFSDDKTNSWRMGYTKKMGQALTTYPSNFATRGLKIEEIEECAFKRTENGVIKEKLFISEIGRPPLSRGNSREGLKLKEIDEYGKERYVDYFFKKDKRGNIPAAQETNQFLFSGIYSLNYPIHKIVYENGVKITATGDQTMSFITHDFFDSIRNEKKVDLENHIIDGQKHNIKNSIIAVAQKFGELACKYIEKLSKQKIPEDLKDEISVGLMTRRLGFFYKMDSEQAKQLEFRLNKYTGKDSQRSIVFFNKHLYSENTLLILENPVFDGASAIKLGYVDKDKTLIVGSFGNPNQAFFDNLKVLIQLGGVFHYKNILIGTDNDEAGTNFYNIVNANLLNVYNNILNKYLEKLQQPAKNITNIEEFNAEIQQALKIAKAQGNEEVEKFLSRIDINISRLVPKDNSKDFNEELIKSLKSTQETSWQNDNLNLLRSKNG